MVELDERRYKDGEAMTSYLSLGDVHIDQRPRNNYYNRSVPLLQQSLTLSYSGIQYELFSTPIANTEADVRAVLASETTSLELLAQLGGCFYLLVQLWHHLIFKHISTHHYLMKMLKKVLYVKLDSKDKAIFGPGPAGVAAGRYEVVRPSDPFQH